MPDFPIFSPMALDLQISGPMALDFQIPKFPDFQPKVLEIWKFGNLKPWGWKSGNLEMWKSGSFLEVCQRRLQNKAAVNRGKYIHIHIYIYIYILCVYVYLSLCAYYVHAYSYTYVQHVYQKTYKVCMFIDLEKTREALFMLR